MSKFTPKDLIAVLVLGACFILLGLGYDSFITTVIALIVGYYFGRRTDHIKINGE